VHLAHFSTGGADFIAGVTGFCSLPKGNILQLILAKMLMNTHTDAADINQNS
jgi:hypothetical protein